MFVLIKIFLAIISLFFTYSQGVELYDSQSQLCCDGKARDLPEDNFFYNYECCGTEIYKLEDYNSFEETSICCGEKRYPQESNTTFCCGAEVYEATTHACLQLGDSEEFRVVPLENNIQVGKTQVCGKSETEREFYDPTKKVCCSGEAHEIVDDKCCCGDKYINGTVSKCCVDYVKDEKTKRYKEVYTALPYNDVPPYKSKCCKGVVLDAEKQKCCGGVAVDLPQNYSSYVYENFLRDFPQDSCQTDFTDFSLGDYSLGDYSLGDDSLACCGSALITNEETQICMNNERIESRDNRNQIPCDGQLHTITGNERLNVYCSNGKVEQLNATELKCSVKGESKTYNVMRQVCDDDVVVDFPSRETNKEGQLVCSKSIQFTYSTTVYPDMIYEPPFDLNYLGFNGTYDYN